MGATGLEVRQITGGMLVQQTDSHRLTEDMLRIVSNRRPTDDEVREMLFAWTVCKHVKSNAIVLAAAAAPSASCRADEPRRFRPHRRNACRAVRASG